MKKFTCPYCYEKHEKKGCKLKCTYIHPTDRSKVCYYGTVSKDTRGWISRKYIDKCMNCKKAKKVFYCVETDKEIPQDCYEGKSLSIALLGAKASGKSNYIGVLVNEIRQKMTDPFDCTVNTAASGESNIYYQNHYYRPLYEEGYVVEATSTEIIPPLIFPLRFLDRRKNVKSVAALSFYDTAGENLDSSESINIKNRYIPNADGIIMLLDPLQIPGVRARLEGKIDLPEKNTDTSYLIDQVKQVIRDFSNNNRGVINIPIALVFTKMDVLEDYNIIDEGSVLREESAHIKRGIFVEEDCRAVNSEIEALLDNFADGLRKQLEEFKLFSLFGVSSLGKNPNGIALGGAIKPKRVLDPLLWILSIKGFIPKVKK